MNGSIKGAKFLIIKKPTNFELHGSEVKDIIQKGGFGSWFYDELKLAHTQQEQTLKELYSVLERVHIEYELVGRFEKWPNLDDYDYVITIGGDGSVLLAAQNICTSRPKLIGIKSADQSEGFLCGLVCSEISSFFEVLSRDLIDFSSVLRLKVEISRVSDGSIEESVPALNEFLYSNSFPAGTSRYGIKFGDQTEIQKSSGVWVSTAVGSSGSILAAGGNVINPKENKAQFFVREPYCKNLKYKILSSCFDPDTQELEIENHCRNALLSVDGTNSMINLEYGDRLKFKKAPSLNLLLSHKRISFYG